MSKNATDDSMDLNMLSSANSTIEIAIFKWGMNVLLPGKGVTRTNVAFENEANEVVNCCGRWSRLVLVFA
jgi:hypothetical protein